MYINNIIYERAPFNGLNPVSVRHHDKIYFLDLYARYRDDTTIDSNKLAYSYESLGIRLLNFVSDKMDLSKTDLIIFTSNQFSRVTEYGSPEFFLKNYFKIPGELYELKELGLLCVFASLHFMIALNNINHYQKILCCSIEGEWIKKNNKNQINKPINNYIATLIIESAKKVNNEIEMIASEIVVKPLLRSFLTRCIDQYKLKCADTLCYLRSNIKKDIAQLAKHCIFNFIDHCTGSEYVYTAIDDLFKINTPFLYKNILIIDYDAPMDSYGILLLQTERQQIMVT